MRQCISSSVAAQQKPIELRIRILLRVLRITLRQLTAQHRHGRKDCWCELCRPALCWIANVPERPSGFDGNMRSFELALVAYQQFVGIYGEWRRPPQYIVDRGPTLQEPVAGGVKMVIALSRLLLDALNADDSPHWVIRWPLSVMTEALRSEFADEAGGADPRVEEADDVITRLIQREVAHA